jgi:hypothetical protein
MSQPARAIGSPITAMRSTVIIFVIPGSSDLDCDTKSGSQAQRARGNRNAASSSLREAESSPGDRLPISALLRRRVPVLFGSSEMEMDMSPEDREAAPEALTATVAAALRQQARHSAHPADKAALQREAVRITLALQSEFLVLTRYSSTAELTDHEQLSEHAHE